MSVTSHDQLTTPLIKMVNDHECPYAERVLTLDTQRQYGFVAYELSSLTQQITALHDAECPPTHVDGSPTKGWSDFVRDTRR